MFFGIATLKNFANSKNKESKTLNCVFLKIPRIFQTDLQNTYEW